MQDIVRVGLIGTGDIAKQAHLPSLSEFKDVEMAAACDVKKDLAEAVGSQYGIKSVFTDYREMLSTIQLDAVYIAVPPQHLLKPAIECFERGLHVFMEKPPGTTKQETAQMASAAAKSHSLSMVGFHRRFSPVSVKARALVEERGPIHQCTANYVKNLIGQPPYYQGKASMLTLDVIHALDNLRWLGGEVKKLKSSTRRLYADYNNSYNAILEFESGAIGFLVNNCAAGKRIFSIEMHAKGISAYVEPEDKAVIYADNKNEGTVIASAEAAGSQAFHHRAGFSAEDRHFIDCVKSGSVPATNLEDAVKTMELLEQFCLNSL